MEFSSPSYENLTLMRSLLDFSLDFNVNLYDRIVMTFYTGSDDPQTVAPEVLKVAQEVLTKFQNNADAWTRVPMIMEKSICLQAKFIALQILQNLITMRWRTLPVDQKKGIRNFATTLTLKLSENDESLERERILLKKLNLAFVQILKREWPHNWPTFISELVSVSKSNLSVCQNNMVVLRLLSEEVFDYSEQMTQKRITTLRSQMSKELTEIFNLFLNVFKMAQKTSLVQATFETLLRFLTWIPPNFIFETDLIDVLVQRFLESPEFRNITLQCLAEVAGVHVKLEYNPKLLMLFTLTTAAINRMLPMSSSVSDAYIDLLKKASVVDVDQPLTLGSAGRTLAKGREFIYYLVSFLSSFLSNHIALLEGEEHRDMLMNAKWYMVEISKVEDADIFNCCLEYWTKFSAELHSEIKGHPSRESGLSSSGSVGSQKTSQNKSSRTDIYADVLANLRPIIIDKMVKPEEILVIEAEGEIIRENLKDSDALCQYKTMRELLVHLTHLDVIDTEALLIEKLTTQSDESQWSWDKINSLSWSIGSISGTMDEEPEKMFVTFALRKLLSYVNEHPSDDDKAVIAANVMYIIGQYPRLLKAHWILLKIVVNKLFEFMHEKVDGVQDMACDTFVKLSQKCRRQFIIQQNGEHMPFIDEILRLMPNIIADLSPEQCHRFYEAVGYMIASQPNKQQQEILIERLMQSPNLKWDSLMGEAARGENILSDSSKVRDLSDILKANVAACTSICGAYVAQIGRMYLDMLGLYKEASRRINKPIRRHGSPAAHRPRVRRLRIIKKEILKLMETYIKKADDLEAVNADLMPPLFDTVLGDYNASVPQARESEVLQVTVTIITRLSSLVTPQIPAILDAVFEPTMEMINKDFSRYVDHRIAIFKLLRVINLNCFPALMNISPKQFKLFVDSVLWAIKHTMREIGDAGLSICLELIDNFANADKQIANVFFQQYFLVILQDIYFVLLKDPDHKSGFRLQSNVLARMYQLAESNKIEAPIFDTTQVADLNVPNSIFLRNYTFGLLESAFPHIKESQVQAFIAALGKNHDDVDNFKVALREFIIQVQDFSSGDEEDIYSEEKELKEAVEGKESNQILDVSSSLEHSTVTEDNDVEIL